MPATDRFVSRPAFLEAVQTAGVLSAGQYEKAIAEIPPQARTGRETARCLVAAGVLTSFQTDRLLAGKTDGLVLGQYVILDQLGRGSYGRVYKARHRTMHRFVAIKVLAAELTRNLERRAAFQAESRAAARIAHPHLVTVYDANQLQDRLYLVLEFVDGQSAEALVRAAGPMAVHRACEIGRQAALGLHHAHDHGIAHGALTPAEVLVGRGAGGRADPPAVKVTGVGLGRFADPTMSTELSTEPLNYRAPEHFLRTAEPTPSADLYALGGTLYFLLIGSPPFPAGADPSAKAHQHLTAVPSDPASFRGDLPRPVADLILQLLDKDPARRPSAAEVAARLEPFAVPDGTFIDFNISPTATGSGSISRGYLTGPLSGPMPAPIPNPDSALVDTSPWAEIEAAMTLDDDPNATAVQGRRRQASEASGWFTLTAAIVAVTIMIATVVAAVWTIRAMTGK